MEAKFFDRTYGGDDPGGARYAIIPKSMCDDGMSDGDIAERYGFFRVYNGPGEFFADRPFVIRRKRWIIICQRFGLDI